MDSEMCRRINSSRFPEFINREVRFIGRIVDIDTENNKLVLESPEGTHVVVAAHRGVKPSSKCVEIFARVLPSLSLEQTGPIVEFGDDLDMSLVNEVINVTFHPQMKEHFEPVETDEFQHEDF